MVPTQMLKGVLEGCILNIIKKEEIYGYEISEKLNSMGFKDISEGTIYPILLRITKNELVNVTYKASSLGPQRKYYSLTDKGREEAAVFYKNWQELFIAVNKLLEVESNE